MKAFVVLVGFLILAAMGAFVFIWSGAYNVAANVPHWEITYKILEEVRERSIANYSKDIQVPPLDDPKLKEAGFHEFHEMCVRCHGAPGHIREPFAMGLYPSPPNLASPELAEELQDSEAFWIVKNGLKMTGMPAFGATHGDDELWAVVAFLKGLHKLTPQEYKAMVEAEAAHGQTGDHSGHSHQ